MGKLIKVDQNLQIKNTDDINDLIKPLSKDIFLFTTKISNTFRAKNTLALTCLKIGDKLDFKKTNSKFNKNEISIVNKKKDILGYVPEQDEIIFARLMDAGKLLYAKIKSLKFSTSVPIIEIDIFLQDF